MSKITRKTESLLNNAPRKSDLYGKSLKQKRRMISNVKYKMKKEGITWGRGIKPSDLQNDTKINSFLYKAWKQRIKNSLKEVKKQDKLSYYQLRYEFEEKSGQSELSLLKTRKQIYKRREDIKEDSRLRTLKNINKRIAEIENEKGSRYKNQWGMEVTLSQKREYEQKLKLSKKLSAEQLEELKNTDEKSYKLIKGELKNNNMALDLETEFISLVNTFPKISELNDTRDFNKNLEKMNKLIADSEKFYNETFNNETKKVMNIIRGARSRNLISESEYAKIEEKIKGMSYFEQALFVAEYWKSKDMHDSGGVGSKSENVVSYEKVMKLTNRIESQKDYYF